MKYLLIILTTSLMAQSVTCDKLYEFYLNHREVSTCKEFKIGAFVYKQLVAHDCILDELDVDMGEFLINEDKKCERIK